MLTTLKTSAVALSLVGSLFVPAIANAQTVSPTDHPRVSLACSNITTRISTAVARYQNNEDIVKQKYQDAVQKVQNSINTLQSKGYDTSAVQSALGTMNQDILARHDDVMNTFIPDLQASENEACGSSQGAYKTALQNAKNYWTTTVHPATLKIRNDWQTLVRPAFQALKSQHPSPTTTP